MNSDLKKKPILSSVPLRIAAVLFGACIMLYLDNNKLWMDTEFFLIIASYIALAYGMFMYPEKPKEIKERWRIVSPTILGMFVISAMITRHFFYG